MSVLRCLAIIVGCSAGFGAAGAILGLALAVGAPGYYRGVFGGGDDPRFHPVAVGLGLGLSQGLICGLIVGAVVVVAVALSNRPISKEPVVDRTPPARWRILALFSLIMAIGCSGAIGFLTGVIVGEATSLQHEADVKLAKIRQVLREPQFQGVTAGFSSAAHVYLTGTVGSRQTRSALEDRLRFLFGDDEAKRMMENVDVAGN